MFFKEKLIRIYSFSSEQLGINPLKTWASIRGFPAFLRDYFIFKNKYKGKVILNPYLGDRFNEGGDAKNEYFWQDLLVSKEIFKIQPTVHVDVGSRIDGFVAHVASYRTIEVFDIRQITKDIPGVIFKQADLMSADSVSNIIGNGIGYCDSLSCLHAIEHFGLGRYGDTVNPLGYKLGIANLSKLLKVSGRLYLSTPIGQERVEFNANWVFDPKTIIDVARSVGLILDQLIVLDQKGGREKFINPSIQEIKELSKFYYRLGIFYFTKIQ
jgi:hypothetical protein